MYKHIRPYYKNQVKYFVIKLSATDYRQYAQDEIKSENKIIKPRIMAYCRVYKFRIKKRPKVQI